MPIQFTFHYVSIKSERRKECKCDIIPHLHSTMYLLNRLDVIGVAISPHNLHSTMYLLNRLYLIGQAVKQPLFTFHYVSIKSQSIAHRTYQNTDLHSTMYLLNQYT